MKRFNLVKLLLIGVALLFSSCHALHSPVSDVHLMKNRTKPAKHTTGVSFSTSVFGDKVEDDLIYKYIRRSDRGATMALQNRIGMALSNSWGNESFSFGLALGGGWAGLDFTWDAGSNFLISGAANVNGNFEGIVHTIHTINDKSSLGLGVFYRSDLQGFLGKDCQGYTHPWLCLNEPVDRHFRVQAAGVRLTYYDLFTPIRYYVGYSPEVEGVVFMTSINLVNR